MLGIYNNSGAAMGNSSNAAQSTPVHRTHFLVFILHTLGNDNALQQMNVRR